MRNRLAPSTASTSRRPVLISGLIAGFLLVGLPAVGLAANASADTAPSATLQLDERAELVSLLNRAEVELLGLTRSVPASKWNHKPAEDSWSVGDVVQHLVLVERGLQKRIRGLAAGEPHPDWRTLEVPTVDALVARITDRSEKASAPEVFHPTETWSKEQALAAFLEARHATRSYVLETDDPVGSVVAPSPVGGQLNGTRLLAVIGAHNLRHNLQIGEVVAAR